MSVFHDYRNSEENQNIGYLTFVYFLSYYLFILIISESLLLKYENNLVLEVFIICYILFQIAIAMYLNKYQNEFYKNLNTCNIFHMVFCIFFINYGIGMIMGLTVYLNEFLFFNLIGKKNFPLIEIADNYEESIILNTHYIEHKSKKRILIKIFISLILIYFINFSGVFNFEVIIPNFRISLNNVFPSLMCLNAHLINTFSHEVGLLKNN